MDELEKLLVRVPPHIKQWYIDQAKGMGQKTAPYVAMILTQHAIENGAKRSDETFEN